LIFIKVRGEGEKIWVGWIVKVKTPKDFFWGKVGGGGGGFLSVFQLHSQRV